MEKVWRFVFLAMFVFAVGCTTGGSRLISPEELALAPPTDALLPVRAIKRAAAVRVARTIPSGKVRLRLFEDTEFTAVTERIGRDEQVAGVMTWTARIEEAKVFGGAMIALSEQGAFGTIQVDGRVFAVRPRAGGGTAVYEVDQAAFPQESEPRLAPSRPETFTPPASRASAGTLKVLVVLPIGAAGPLCTMPLLQRLFIQAANLNLNRVWSNFTGSGVYSADTRLYCTTYTPVGGDLKADLDWVQNDPGVAAARTATGANMVSLWVIGGTSCGYGYTNYPTASWQAPYAFNVVDASCAFEGYSFAHELGHNLGMRHDRFSVSGGGDPKECNYGFSILNGTSPVPVARTVMAYSKYCTSLGVDCPRVPVYSSPQPTPIVFGIPCSVEKPGVEGSANNAAQFVTAAPIAAGWH